MAKNCVSIIIILFIMLAVGMTASASENDEFQTDDTPSSQEGDVESESSEAIDFWEFLESLPGIEKHLSDMESVIVPFADAANSAWEDIGTSIKDFGTNNGMLPVDAFSTARTFEGVFKTLAYSICVLFFGLNILNTTIKYELFTFKGSMGVTMRVLFAKIWIDLSYKICEWIIELNDSIVSAIFNISGNSMFIKLPEIEYEASDIKLIGPIIDALMIFFKSIPLLIFTVIFLIAAWIIIIKLMIRMIEIALMITVAPPFFACLAGGETTQRYFRNFMVTFTQVVVQTIFMAIVYGITSTWWTDIGNLSYQKFLEAFIPNLGIVFVMVIMIVKPPKILTNLIN